MIRSIAIITILFVLSSCSRDQNIVTPKSIQFLNIHLNDSVATYVRLELIDSTIAVVGLSDEQFKYQLTRDQDTFILQHPFYTSFFKLWADENSLFKGYFHQPDRSEQYRLKVSAEQNPPNFHEIDEALPSVLYTTFSPKTLDEYKGIGYFETSDTTIKGTIRTETGDYRFLEGGENANLVSLSAFDGSHVFAFRMNKSEKTGMFYSGNHWSESFVMSEKDSFQLKEPEHLTYGTGLPVSFSFNDLETNKTLRLSDSIFAGKPLAIQLFGSWCPNCYDESVLLNQLQKEFPDVSFIGVAFERQAPIGEQQKRVKRFVKKLSLDYSFALGGTADKDSIAKRLPWLSGFSSYPTVVFLNKQHEISGVHTGFNGPATGIFYENTIQKFKEELGKL